MPRTFCSRRKLTTTSQLCLGGVHSFVHAAAGLWEFPSVMLDGGGPAERGVLRSKINDYLRDTLELFPDKMAARRELGSVSHTFSHIAMTLDVEMMSVEVHALCSPI